MVKRDREFWLKQVIEYTSQERSKALARGDKDAAAVLVNIGASLILVKTDGKGE